MLTSDSNIKTAGAIFFSAAAVTLAVTALALANVVPGLGPVVDPLVVAAALL